MGCCGDREKDAVVKTEQRWDYINLDDFKTHSCWTPLAYGWLLLMFVVSMSVYVVDTFTAVNLIVFDKWSGQIQPAIPFYIARWIFAGCIIASFVFLFYRWWRAIRVMKKGAVAKSYLDPLAVRIESIRMGGGRGYKRFLVFAELTKSRKGADYVALFAYFSYEAWMRVVFAEGPRQAVNAITLYSVMMLNLIPDGDHNTEGNNSAFVQFWVNLGRLADKDKLQAAILLGMLWTFMIWVLAFISLLVSVILYLIFLWHHIPKGEGPLSRYCRNKINRRLERIVKVNVDKALKKENDKRIKQEAKAQREGLSIKSQPTLPDVTIDISKQALPPLSRQGTMTTLPEYESRPGSIRTSNETVPPVPGAFNDPHRPGPKRNGTQRSDTSWSSYHSNAPLINSAAEMGMQTPTSANSAPWSARTVPQRSATGFSQYTDRSNTPGPRPSTAQSGYDGHSYQMEPLPRSGTSASNTSHRSRQNSEQDVHIMRGQPGPGYPPPAGLNGSYFPAIPEDRNSGRFSPAPGQGRSFTAPEQHIRSMTPAGQPQRSFTPAAGPPSYRPYNANEQPPRSYTPGGPTSRTFTPQAQPPPARSLTPHDQPTLPQIDTDVSSHPGYTPVQQRSTTPNSGNPYSQNPYQSHYHAPQIPEYRSYSRAHDRPSRANGATRDDGVDDILNHY